MNAILFLSRICGEWKLVKILPVNLASITHVPPECLLRNSDANSRVQLLRGLKGGFAISVAKPEPGQTKLRPGNKLDATVVLKIDRAPVKQPPDQESLWADSWGGYGDGETPEWVNLRHALAHMRTPLFATDDLKNAINIYAPRFIELLFRLKDHGHADITDSDQDDWITWWDNPRWKESARLPWLRDKLDISNLLHLPPDQTRDS